MNDSDKFSIGNILKDKKKCKKKNKCIKINSDNICDFLDIANEQNTDNLNIERITYLNIYINKITDLFNEMYCLINKIINDFYDISNTLNFCDVNEEIIENYNKCLNYMFNVINNILETTILTPTASVHIIKKPNDEKRIYCYNIELRCIYPNSILSTKYLGEISNISINIINNNIIFQRRNKQFLFILLDETYNDINNINISTFRNHLDTYISSLNEIGGLIHNDIEILSYTKKTFINTVKNLIEEHKNIHNNYNHNCNCKCCTNFINNSNKKWCELLEVIYK
jgi:hypothetical protein